MGSLFDPKNQTSTSQVNLPSYVSDAYQNALGRVTTASQATPNYQGELSAGTQPLQQQAYAGLPGAVNSAQPYINQAAGLTAQGTAPTSIMPYSPSALGQYMNPYTQSVVDATQNQFNLQNAQQQSSLTGNAASQHALGGDRSAVAAAQLAGQQQTAQAPVIAGLNQANFNQATQEFNTQQQTDLSNQQANAYRALYGAGEYGNLGQLTQGSQLAGFGAELTAGQTQQQTAQNADTAQYQNYLLQLGYPMQQAQALTQATTALGGIYSGNKTNTTPGPSPFAQIAGVGLAAYGMGAFGRGGSLHKFADGGSDDDSDTDDEASQYDPADNNEGSAFANSALAAIAAPHAGATTTAAPPAPSGLATAPTQPQGGPRLDPYHQGLVAAGLGMMSARGDALSGIGQGGLAGLKAYDTAEQQERQMQALQGQTAYRQAMSSAATTRAQALAQHYDNADKKPVLIKGKTYQWYYPSDGSYHDTHIDNPEFVTGQTSAKLRQEALDRPSDQWQSGSQLDPKTGQPVQGMWRLPTKGGSPTFMPGDIVTGHGSGAGGVTTQLISQLQHDNPKMSTQDALALIKDPSGQNGFKLNNSAKNLALQAAKADIRSYTTDPGGTIQKYNDIYGVRPDPVGIPPKIANAPDGSRSTSKGWLWEKRGGQMIPLSKVGP